MKRVILLGFLIIFLISGFFLFPFGSESSVIELSTDPDPLRFQLVELYTGLDEPMELAVLPDSNVLLIERKGAVKMYLHQTHDMKTMAELNVFHGIEDGLLGLTLDPDFNNNNFIYLFYSPAGSQSIQRVSRFILKDKILDLSSEITIIEIPTQREECCHSAGSLAFGPDGTLYIAVGDNTNPHNPGYYNSIDERPGREFWDAQRTAANTHDLRGKILRIKPAVEGGYIIPDGNLFAKDGSEGKPEIYAMGCRNPYRITIDQKKNILYWGDVGQNTIDNPARGPISYDEFHQAKTPGFFGWPYFAGNNEPYADFDFETEEIGPFFNPKKPINDSPNNTGRVELPPAQGAFIWYTYDSSMVFDHLGTGGKSPIIGPVYYSELAPKVAANRPSRKFPDYFNGKLFIAEWMRDWVNVVTMNEDGSLKKIEKFMPASQFNHPIDLEFGPDGALYVLEYGTFWFAKNTNSRLSRIEYNQGNRPPVAAIKADKTIGAVPFTINFSGEESYDLDKKDQLTYSWLINNTENISGKNLNYTFTKPGIYNVELQVKDSEGSIAKVATTVQAGNEMAKIQLAGKGNKTFYWPGEPFSYQIEVSDPEDGSLSAGEILPSEVDVSLSYFKDEAMLKRSLENKNDYIETEFYGGLELINQSDCKACHHLQEKSIGPTYQQIAARYENNPSSIQVLAEKIIKGGSGNWGETAMSAHPQVKVEEASEMVKYILGLNDKGKSNLQPEGEFNTTPADSGNFVIKVAYHDQGGEGVGPVTAREAFVIRNPVVPAIYCDEFEGVSIFNNEVVKFIESGAYIKFADIDLTEIKYLTLNLSASFKGQIECRADSVDGKILGLLDHEIPVQRNNPIDASKKNDFLESPKVPLRENEGIHNLYFVFKDLSGSASMWNAFEVSHINFFKK